MGYVLLFLPCWLWFWEAGGFPVSEVLEQFLLFLDYESGQIMILDGFLGKIMDCLLWCLFSWEVVPGCC